MKCLAYTRKGTSIYFERQRLCLPDGDSIRMPVASRIKSWLGRWRCFERLFRLEPRCAAFLSPDKLLVAYQRKLWIVDIDNAEIVKTISVRQGFSDILSFCQMAHGEVYYGDYGMNSGEEPIHMDNRKGLGIKSADVFVYYVSDEGKLHLLERYKKDGWPMRLLQYGCVQFPALEDESVKEVPVNPVAVKKCDGKPQTLIWQ